MKALSYIFTFKDGREERLSLTFDAEMRLQQQAQPHWTALDFHRCPHCPLAADVGHCPFAAGLAPFIGNFAECDSYARVQVVVRSELRLVAAERALQHGLASLIGLIGATSGCPHLEFFRPMARFHLPFASEEETLVRAFSMHLLEDWVIGRVPSLDDLGEHYLAAAQVNRTMADRIRAVCRRDAVVNALVSLDAYAQAVPFVLEEKLAELRYIFQPPSTG